MANLSLNDGAQVGSQDTVPAGDVDVYPGEAVCATDGVIGRVRGLVADPASHHVTHVLLEEGHLWGRRQVAIPIAAVTRVGDIIRLTIGKRDVENLPPVDVDHPAP
jgi:sporulation protein YlmC with PRC-barrel domain